MRLFQRCSRLSCVSILSLALALSACGSGGGESTQTSGATPGGTSAGGGSGFSVAIDRTQLSFVGEEGASIAPAVVLGTGSGSLPAAIHLGSLDLGASIERVTAEAVGAQVKFTVHPRSDFLAGEYRGRLQLFACPDDKCASHFGGSPVEVVYTFTITKGFKVTPSSVQLTAISGATASTEVGVQVQPGQTFTALPSTSSSWLGVSNVTATGFVLAAKAMPAGNYSGSVAVTSGGRTRDVAVTYLVTGDSSTVGKIVPDVSSLSFSAVTTATAPSRVVNVTLPSWTKELGAEIRYPEGASGWLSAVKSGEKSITVTASASALAAGTYQADLILKSDQVTAPATVPVSFAVGAASWTIDGTTAFAVSGDTTAASLSGELSIGLASLPSQAYNASTTATWLKLSSTRGMTGGAPLRISIDQAELLGLANFQSYTAEIAISAVDTRIAPTRVTVRLDKALPELHFVSPHTRLPGEAGVYTLRGRGLDGIANLSQALQVTGATPGSLTRVSDTEARLNLPGAATGNVSFTLRNALGAQTGAPVLRALSQGTFSYAAIATAGAKGSLVFDAERQALYSVNKTMQAVMRFAYSGGAWTVRSASLPDADAVALSPDGKSLVATSSAGNIVLLDPATLERQDSYAAGTVGGNSSNGLQRLAVTNDGRAYFQAGSLGTLTYFDLVAREVRSIGDSQQYSFNGGPWFSVSGDGSRLDIVQSASMSPAPPMLYLDSSDATPKVNPAGLNFWYESSQSLRGERFVEGTYKVWDRSFALIGNIVLPDTRYFGRTPVASPDGTRVYVLAYHQLGLSGTAVSPRVYVFDSSTRMAPGINLPLLGHFDLADYPTCRTNAAECDTRALGSISPDGKTLFFIGDTRLVVAPIRP